MNACARQGEVAQTVRAGQWPQGCAVELREHVSACPRCGEEAKLLLAFAAAREGAMRLAAPQSPELLWWKAQLRRRHEVVERLERPGLMIFTTAVTASIVLLLMVLATVWKHLGWYRLAGTFSVAGSNVWVGVSLAALLCGFATVAAVVGLGSPEERPRSK